MGRECKQMERRNSGEPLTEMKAALTALQMPEKGFMRRSCFRD
jgi:hypothetical protein